MRLSAGCRRICSASKERLPPVGMTSSPSSTKRWAGSVGQSRDDLREIARQALARATQQLDLRRRCGWRCSESRPTSVRTASPRRAAVRRPAVLPSIPAYGSVPPYETTGPTDASSGLSGSQAHVSMIRHDTAQIRQAPAARPAAGARELAPPFSMTPARRRWRNSASAAAGRRARASPPSSTPTASSSMAASRALRCRA